jgi:hypothetical protein
MALFVVYLMLIITAIIDSYVNIYTAKGERGPAIIAQAIVLMISIYYVFKSYNNKVHIIGFHKFLTIFIILLSIYAMFSNTNRLPICLLAISSFFVFYYSAYNNTINFRQLQYFAIILLLIYMYQTYVGYIRRTDIWSGNIQIVADNTGYRAMYLMLLFSFFIKKKQFILYFSLALFLVFVSLKRGAILIGLPVYIIILCPNIKKNIKTGVKNNFSLKIFTVILIAIIGYIIISNFDLLSYRFLSDETGGSGRKSTYTTIFNAWRNGSIGNILFGFGFYNVSNLLLGGMNRDALTYAHSDLQVLYDHGLLGIITYISLFISVFINIKVVKRFSQDYYHLFLSGIFTWFLKSIYSGVYMNKDSIILFMVFGIVLGTTYREKHKQGLYKILGFK